MIPLSWMVRTRAPRRCILVDREGVREKSGLIILSPHYKQHTRTALGTIVDIHPACGERQYRVGDYVMLNVSSGRMIVYGYTRDEERELWVYPPEAVKLVFLEKPIRAEDHGESVLRNERYVEARTGTATLDHVEGETEALR